MSDLSRPSRSMMCPRSATSARFWTKGDDVTATSPPSSSSSLLSRTAISFLRSQAKIDTYRSTKYEANERARMPDRSFCIIHTGHPILIFKGAAGFLVTRAYRVFSTVYLCSFFSLSLSTRCMRRGILRFYPSCDQTLRRYIVARYWFSRSLAVTPFMFPTRPP